MGGQQLWEDNNDEDNIVLHLIPCLGTQAMRTVCEDKNLCQGIFLSFDFLCRDNILCRDINLVLEQPSSNMSNMDIIFMSYKEQHLDVQEDHFPAFDFKGGEKSPQAKVDKILIYTLGCKFLG